MNVLIPTFRMIVVTSWRYFVVVKLKNVHGQTETMTIDCRQKKRRLYNYRAMYTI